MSPFALPLSKSADAKRWPILCLIVAGAVAACWAANFCLKHDLAWRCPAQVLFGLPCPSCGTTRALAALSRFEVVTALRFNPLVTLALPIWAGVAWWYCLPVRGAAPARVLPSRFWLLLVTAILMNWLYLLLFLPR